MNGRDLIALMALAVLLVGCGPSPADGPSLEGTQWVLITLEGEALLPGTTPSAEFSVDQISGSASCNHYFGTYTVSGSEITITDVARTEMYCMDPEGVMDQEEAFLAALSSVASYRLSGTRLELLDTSGGVALAFEPPPAVSEAPSPSPPAPDTVVTRTAPTSTAEVPTPVPPTPTPEATETALPPAFEAPAGFKLYQDSVTEISVYVPESWVVTGVTPGQSAILQSYPEDKYVGGGGQHPGDTKCDLTIRPPDVSVADAVQALRSDTYATIVSEQEVVLLSGQPGIRMEVESMGPSISLFTEINERTVVLTCFGEFEPVDQIAGTLGASE
jgi:heat shock protein HslJ